MPQLARRKEMIRMGLIGAGTMGDLYAKAFSQYRDSQMVAVCDLNQELAGSLAKKYGIEKVYSSYDKMLADCPMEAVTVSTPDFVHRAPAVACLEAGKHVLCEKPMATTVEDCLAMVKAVDRSGKKLMINFGNRHRPVSFKVREQLASGQLGPIEHVYMRLNEKRTKTDTLAWADRTSPLWFLLSHVTDYLRWMVGAEIVEVYGVGYTGYLKKEKGLDTPDTMVFLVKFENGASATLEGSWVLPTSYPRVVDCRFDIIGEQGMVQIDLYEQGCHTFFETAADHPWDWGVPDFTGNVTGWWYNSCYYFVDCLEKGRRPKPDERDGLAVVEALVAMEQSYRQGTNVRVVHHKI
jgi:predicted dehydrogenase